MRVGSVPSVWVLVGLSVFNDVNCDCLLWLCNAGEGDGGKGGGRRGRKEERERKEERKRGREGKREEKKR